MRRKDLPVHLCLILENLSHFAGKAVCGSAAAFSLKDYFLAAVVLIVLAFLFQKWWRK
jgi:hypothetical protein